MTTYHLIDDAGFGGINRMLDHLTTALAETAGKHEIVRVKRGDVVFFDGVLVHRGGPIGQPGSFRHVLANHYIARDFNDWPHVRWPRVAFDGSERFTD